jgi:hypothetical protein
VIATYWVWEFSLVGSKNAKLNVVGIQSVLDLYSSHDHLAIWRIMFIRQQFKTVAGKRRAYWALVESVRSERDSRHKVVSWLGTLDEAGRLVLLDASRRLRDPGTLELPENRQPSLFDYEEDLVEPARSASMRTESALKIVGNSAGHGLH